MKTPRAVFVSISILLMVLGGCYLPSTRPYEIVSSRYGLILAGERWGSTVNIGNSYCLTANHVVSETNEALYADHDVALVLCQKPMDTLITNYIVSLGQTVYWMQPAWAESTINIYSLSGNIILVNDSEFVIDKPVFPGASGSGVFNERGELVGVIVQLKSFHEQITYGVAVRVSQLKQHFERARRKR